MAKLPEGSGVIKKKLSLFAYHMVFFFLSYQLWVNLKGNTKLTCRVTACGSHQI